MIEWLKFVPGELVKEHEAAGWRVKGASPEP
jgi:hypothetical protein